MAEPARSDGSDTVRGSVWLLAAALALVGLAIVLVVRPILAARRATAAAERATRVAAAPPGQVSAPVGPPPRRSDVRPVRRAPPAARDATGEVPADDRQRTDPSGASGEAAAAQAGDGDGEAPLSGIALFPPPGTKPIKPGIVVPDDFELPPGYVRHFQTTDDGQQLPAILMFHPDFEWVDAAGQRIALPADHVVPPDLAPPGLPIKMLAVPDNHVPTVEQPPPGAVFEADAP